ncbi:hypothetical protein SAY86_000731 [Trapa natans]|uniref:Uncharacterized protein n=1 Tax=Trapa natans TaxID=22666 RepID=A0AAN7M4H1_TRANT|nr:hypothetical protein SAY86_000731 [Trapa natans]
MELYYSYCTFFASAIFLFFLSLFLLKPNRQRLPPGPIGFPILGSIPQLGSKVHQSLAQMAKRHGPLMSLRLGSKIAVLVTSVEVAREMLGTHEKAFSDRPVADAIGAQPNPELTVAWVTSDQLWRSRRRTCTIHLFSPISLDAHQKIRHEKVRQLVRYIEMKHAAAEEPVDIGKVAFATILNLISSTVLSVDAVDPEFESAQEFKDLVWRIMEDFARPNLSDFFRLLRPFDLQGLRRNVTGCFERLYEILEEIIEKRVKERAAAAAEGVATGRNCDFLDVLLDQCQEEGSGVDRLHVKALVSELFIAGSDTTSTTIEWAMAELLRNPKVLEKARQEILTVVGLQRPIQESDINNLPYLQAIVKETLRLHPATPLLIPHKAKHDVEVLGYVVPKDAMVMVNVWAIARDPSNWTDPLEFRPERFAVEPGLSVYVGIIYCTIISYPL